MKIFVGYVQESVLENDTYYFSISSIKKGLLSNSKDYIYLETNAKIDLTVGMLYQFKLKDVDGKLVIISHQKLEDIVTLNTLVYFLTGEKNIVKNAKYLINDNEFQELSIETDNKYLIQFIEYINKDPKHLITRIDESTQDETTIDNFIEAWTQISNISKKSFKDYLADDKLINKISLLRAVYNNSLFQNCFSQWSSNTIKNFFSIHSLSPSDESLFKNSVLLLIKVIINNTESNNETTLIKQLSKKLINFYSRTYGSKISVVSLSKVFEEVIIVLDQIQDSYNLIQRFSPEVIVDKIKLINTLRNFYTKDINLLMDELAQVDKMIQISNDENGKYLSIETSNFAGDIENESSSQIEKMLALEIVKLIRRNTTSNGFSEFNDYFNEINQRLGLLLSDKQKEAIEKLFNENFLILLGKAGSGKSTTVSLFLKKYIELFPNNKIVILSPTGAAAVVIQRAIQKAGITSGIGITIDTLASDVTKHFPKIDLLIFEESSMINQKDLLKHFQNIKIIGKVVFLGDYGQLPSIQMGRIIESMISNNVIKENHVIELSESFREHRTNNKLSINEFANLIRDGHDIANALKIIKSGESSVSIQVRDSNYTQNIDLIKSKYSHGENSIILSSTNIGHYGTKMINYNLQSKFAMGPVLSWDVENFAQHDPIVWTSNFKLQKGYKKFLLIQNGASGLVEKIDHESITLEFELANSSEIFSEFMLDYQSNSLDIWKGSWDFRGLNLENVIKVDTVNNKLRIVWHASYDKIPFTLQYCSTIHKVQGNQFEKVILLLDKSNSSTFTKKHFYTALTRAMSTVEIIILNCLPGEEDKFLEEISQRESVVEESTELGKWIDSFIADYPHHLDLNQDCKHIGKYYNGVHYDFDSTTRQFTFKPHILQVLKDKNFIKDEIGGSSLGDVLGLTSFSSPLRLWMNLFGMKLPSTENKSLEAGILLEPKIIRTLEKQLMGEKIITFTDLNSDVEYEIDNRGHIGGRPDGFIESKEIVLEIKTAKEEKFEDWRMGNIPPQYIRQAQLYSYLLKVDKFIIAALFLKDIDYENPGSVNISNRKLKLYNFKVNTVLVEDDIAYVNKWYENHVLKGVSPIFHIANELKYVEWLSCANDEERKNWEEKYIFAMNLYNK